MRSNVHSARQHVAALRAALLAPSPEALEAQIPLLEQAVHGLRELEPPGPGNAGEVRVELQSLALELNTAGKLIGHGLAFQQAWARLLAAAFGGYRPDGEPAPLPAPGSISVEA